MSANTRLSPLARAHAFAAAHGCEVPIMLAPMAGACPPGLSIAIANAGGMGAMGALLSSPAAIHRWVEEFHEGSHGPFQINLWVPDPPPIRDAAHEHRVREFMAAWGPEVLADAA